MRDKKIGIITFHASHNCGSMLQAYALQTYLEKNYKISTEIIDFSSEEQKRCYSLLYKPRSIKQVLRNILNLFFIRRLKKHFNDYEDFKNNKLKLSEGKYSTCEQLAETVGKYSCIISGSDQIWNTRALDFSDAYFGAFDNETPKYAYAVSLGATDIFDCEEKRKEQILGFINGYARISVREKNAQRIIGNGVNQSVEICADPTLLLEPSEWNYLTGKPEIKGKYIFWYAMTYKRDVSKVVEKISADTGLPIYVIDAKEWSRRGLFRYGIRVAEKGGPASFLSLVKNAEIVITSSFHGTVFSYLFRKKFWYLNIHDKPTKDDRASSLLEQLGLLNRYVSKTEMLKKDINEPIYFNNDDSMKECIEKSREFIDHITDDIS